MTALTAVKPEIKPEVKPKILISGRAGVGKTMFALEFPTPYYIDTEGGATRRQYQERLIANGGAYFGKEQGSQDFNIVLEQIKSLGTTKHHYKTLVIDSFSHLYLTAAAIAEETVGSDYSRDRKEANRPSRQLIRWIEKLDMTVLLVCHHKDKWERNLKKELVYAGSTFDGFDKLEFTLDLWIEATKREKIRAFFVKKSRIDSFPEGAEFPLLYAEFSELYGKSVIEQEAKPIVTATPEQLEKLEGLLKVVTIDPETVERALKKADADNWKDMSSENIQKFIEYVQKRVTEVTKK